MSLDAVIVGSGPNGLTAAAVLATAGRRVLVLEAAATLGGGLRTAELTLPGFRHDVCAAVHPTGALSPAFRELDLENHGLQWARSRYSYGHPFDDGPAALAELDLDATAARLGVDGSAWKRLNGPFLRDPERLFGNLLAPLGVPDMPFAMALLGLRGVWGAHGVARSWFSEEPARALFAGCAAHSCRDLDGWLTAAVGLVFSVSAHATNWPVAVGGSQAVADALASVIRAHGGAIETDSRVQRLGDLPDSRAVLFDLAPSQVAAICADALPQGYRDRLGTYEHGPGSFKVDWALDGPIPWTDTRLREASTVHVGGTADEVAAAEAAPWRGEHAERPFLILCQQSELDASRAPAGKHTGYAYCHVPAGSDVDMTDRIEAQIDRFAPGFRDLILARHKRSPKEFEAYNPALIGGAVTGGPGGPTQLFTRPVMRLDPYSTPNPRLFHCGQYTPPGGGVHGMCGYYAAKSALSRVLR